MDTSHSERQIRSWGRRLKRVTLAMLCLVPVAFFFALRWADLDTLLHLPESVRIDRHGLSAADWLVVASLSLIRPLAFVPILWWLYRLFASFETGVVFSLHNARLIKYCGLMLIGVDALAIVQGMLIGPVLSQAGVTTPFFSIEVALSYSIVGLFIYLVSMIMGLAQAIREEQDLTI